MIERKNMKILVTGAAGFIGTNLIKRLIADGYVVRAFVRKGEDISNFDPVVEIAYGDIVDQASLDSAVKDIDMVYHLASMVQEAGVPDRLFWEVNVRGTERLLEVSQKSGVKRFIHMSTCGVHGNIKHPPASENYPFDAKDIYQITKAEGEKAAIGFMDNGLSVVVIRPTGVYGPGDRRLLKLFRLIKNKRFFMVGDGNIFFHPVYIDDLIESLILAGRVAEAVGEAFIIGGERYLTLNELTETIAKNLGVPLMKFHIPIFPVMALAAIVEFVCKPLNIEPPLFRRRVDFFTKNRAFDISKAKRLLGYQPKVDIEKGIEQTIEWYKKEGLL